MRHIVKGFDPATVRTLLADAQFLIACLAAIVEASDDGEVFISYERIGKGQITEVEAYDVDGGFLVRINP